ncbi:MAG: TonB-dependent siderophore receptor, partial [Acetobacter papayae]
MEPELAPRIMSHPRKPGLRQAWLNRPVILAIPTGLFFALTSLNTLPARAADATVVQAAQTAAHAYNIPSQPLGQALAAYGKQTGIQITYDPALLAGKTSAPVTGSMSAQE